ncbi:MAG: hypothetical protein K2N64_01090 [Anaeroplasmataceae bacterium]|nr:hypothetical protein [Anaeroplasmataceae bacterium]
MKTMLKYVVTSIFVLIFSFMALFGSGFIVNASVDEYTDVVADLKQDKTFNEYDFPHRNEDYSIQVIQIAETKLNNLCVYAYSPAYPDYDLKATEISLSIGENIKDLSPQIYKLKLLSQSGVFSKYMVEGLEVPSTPFRYYNLVSIYRPFNDNIDTSVAEVTNAVAYEIGQRWCTYTLNNEITYEMETINVLDVTIQFKSFVRYQNGFNLHPSSCDAHYIGFSCEDYIIEKIYDADVCYSSREVTETWALGVGTSYSYDNVQENVVVTLTDKDSASHKGDGLFAKTYHWNRIESKEEFLNREDIKDDAKELLKDSQWILRFTETDYSSSGFQTSAHAYYTEVTDVTILRLHFYSKGVVYNLGVIADRVSGTNIPSNNNTNELDFSPVVDMFQKILAVIGVLVLLAITAYAFPIVSTFFSVCYKVTKKIVNFILSLLIAPFKLFGKKKH